MIGVAGEVSIFISSCLLGNLICMVYCALRVFRRLIKHKLFWISVEDLVFWIFSGLYLFSKMYQTCAGNIRWYFVLGVVVGGILTGQILQKLIEKIDKKVVDKTIKTE